MLILTLTIIYNSQIYSVNKVIRKNPECRPLVVHESALKVHRFLHKSHHRHSRWTCCRQEDQPPVADICNVSSDSHHYYTLCVHRCLHNSNYGIFKNVNDGQQTSCKQEHPSHLPLSSNRQHYETDDCLEDNREDYSNYHYVNYLSLIHI